MAAIDFVEVAIIGGWSDWGRSNLLGPEVGTWTLTCTGWRGIQRSRRCRMKLARTNRRSKLKTFGSRQSTETFSQ